MGPGPDTVMPVDSNNILHAAVLRAAVGVLPRLWRCEAQLQTKKSSKSNSDQNANLQKFPTIQLNELLAPYVTGVICSVLP